MIGWLWPWSMPPRRSRTPAKLTEPDKWARFFGTHATEDHALKLAAAYACVRLKSETIGSCPCHVLRPGSRGAEWTVKDSKHPLFRIVHNQPNQNFDAFRFWSSVFSAIDLHGNAFMEKIRNSRGDVIALEYLYPHLISTRAGSDGDLIYTYADPVTKARREITQRNVIHVRQFSQGAPLGISAITYGSRSIMSGNAIEDTAFSTFFNGLRPGGYITTGGRTLTDDQRKEAQKNLIEDMRGPLNSGKWQILEAGFEAKPMDLNPDDYELLASRRWTVEDVCRWFGVPPVLIGHMADGATGWGTGIAETIRAWRMTSLRSSAITVEKQLEVDLLSVAEIAEGVTIRFNLDAILRGDTAERGTHLGNMVDKGIMTRNEARALENLPPVDGGDVLTVQQQMIPLSMVGQTQQRQLTAPVPANQEGSK